MIDSHTHLFLCEGEERDLVDRALEAGVRRILNVGLDEETNARAIAAAERNPSVFATVGRHPTAADGYDDRAAAEIARLAGHDRVRAIGETGIDHYRESASPDGQRRAFESQIEIARESSLPIVIHARDPEGATSASDEVFEILDARGGGVAVILHCFLAPWRLDDAIERGWYCSFSGIVSYPQSDDRREAAARLPDELLLVETDAPYLAPQPVRSKPNQPAHVVSTARVVAEARGVSYEEVERVVEANGRTLFDW